MIFLGDLSTSRPQANTGQPDGDVGTSTQVPCSSNRVTGYMLFCGANTMGRVAREVRDGLPSRASAGSTLGALGSTGAAAVGPCLEDDGDLDLCDDRSLLLPRRVSAALAYTPRSAVLAAPRNTCLSSADGRRRGNGVRESCNQDEAEGGVVVTNPQHCLLLPPHQRLRLYPAPELLVALPHPRFQPIQDVADKRCPRPG